MPIIGANKTTAKHFLCRAENFWFLILLIPSNWRLKRSWKNFLRKKINLACLFLKKAQEACREGERDVKSMSFSLSPLGVLKGSLFTSLRSSAKKTFLYRRRESWYYFAFQLITSGSSSLLFDVIKTLLCQTKNNFLWTALISVAAVIIMTLKIDELLIQNLWWQKWRASSPVCNSFWARSKGYAEYVIMLS